MAHKYFSQRMGLGPHRSGLPLPEVLELFKRLFKQLESAGYFAEALGYDCVDYGHVEGKISDIRLQLLLDLGKDELWPIADNLMNYAEDDLFDVMEFMFQHVSKGIDGMYHSFADCGMHWSTFDKAQGQKYFREQANKILLLYERKFQMSETGEVLSIPDQGFDRIFNAEIPTSDSNISQRMRAAIIRFNRHGASLDDRRLAVRDLADVLEYLRPNLDKAITKKDEADLFRIANEFGIRHHNDRPKTSYDAAIWLSWMFYFYLATIHAVLRKLEREGVVAGKG